MEHSSPATRRSAWVPLLYFVLGVATAGAAFYIRSVFDQTAAPDLSLHRDPIHIELGKVRKPLPYRIVSFHRGRADKRLIQLAAQLGFNGVQIQLEGSTLDGLKNFAKYDASEHLVDFCHQLNMQVTLWVHELSDVPAAYMPESFGEVTVDNSDLWDHLAARYDWVLGTLLPQIDGLCLTVVETKIRVTDGAVLAKLTDTIRQACDQHHKSLQVRTFVWFPEELAGVMAAVKQLPQDTVMMSKCVPQDWNLRGINAGEIGNVGGRTQIEEFDVCGEYFLRDHVANCMPALLKRQFDYGVSHNISGICVRVDRDDSSVLHEPNEVNLWALGMLAGGASDNVDEIWTAWASNRFGTASAPAVIKALKPTSDVVAEAINIGPFTFGDTRKFPPLGDEDVFGSAWQSYWWDKSFEQSHQRAERGDPRFIQDAQQAKAAAMKVADQCLADLEQAKASLSPEDYAILKTKLFTNKMQLAFRTPMALAVLHYRRMLSTYDTAVQNEMKQAIAADLDQLRTVATPLFDMPTELTYLGKKWQVGPPEDYWREPIFEWARSMDMLRRGDDPRNPYHRRKSIWR